MSDKDKFIQECMCGAKFYEMKNVPVFLNNLQLCFKCPCCDMIHAITRTPSWPDHWEILKERDRI